MPKKIIKLLPKFGNSLIIFGNTFKKFGNKIIIAFRAKYPKARGKEAFEATHNIKKSVMNC